MRRGYTLIEMLTTVAVLVIVLGLMVSLARYVRAQSAEDLTQELLRKLERVMAQYVADNAGGIPPVAPLLNGPGAWEESALSKSALLNNEQFVRVLAGEKGLSGADFSDLSIATYDMRTIRDAWGSPIVLMPRQHPAIGMAPQDRYFFFSAGPDRQYLTRADNLYSYETAAGR